MADLQWSLNLRDGLSSAASRMRSSVANLSQGLASASSAAKRFTSDLSLAGSLGVDQLRQKLAGMPGLTKGLEVGLLGVAAAGAAAAAGLGVAIVKAASFRESSVQRLSALLGSQEAGMREFKDAVKIAERTPYDPKDVVTALAQLSTGFKNDDQRRELFGAISDFTTIVGGGDKELLKRLTTVVTQVQAKGKLQGEELMQFAEAGGSQTAVLDALITQLGIKEKDINKARDAVRKAMSGGKITGDQGVYAIYQAMRSQSGGGAAGAATEAGAGSIAGLISNIQGGLDTLLLTADTTNWPAITSLKTLLSGLATVFSTDSADGQRLTGVLRDLSSSATPMIQLLGYEFTRLKDGMLGAGPEAENFRRGLVGISYAAQGVAYVIYGLYRVVAFAAGGLVQLFGAAVQLGDWLGDLAFDAMSAGGAIVDGLIQGIKNKAAAVADALKGIAHGAVSTVKETLGIRSPSTVFASLGEFTAEGFVQGLGAVDPAGAAARLAQGAADAITAPSTGRAGAGGLAMAGGGMSLSFGDVYLSSNATDPASAAAEWRRGLADEVEAVLQRMRQS